jgi:hypothetical protein
VEDPRQFIATVDLEEEDDCQAAEVGLSIHDPTRKPDPVIKKLKVMMGLLEKHRDGGGASRTMLMFCILGLVAELKSA